MDKSRYLIEIGTPPLYWCAYGDWCGNANHAIKYRSRADAEAVVDEFINKRIDDPPRVVEHMWAD